jgi:hypothetical protein
MRAEPALPLQIKEDHRLPVRGVPVPFTLAALEGTTRIMIDGRQIPVSSYQGAPLHEIASSVARVPRALRNLLACLVISPKANATDAAWSQRYGLPVLAAMGATASGRVSIYPHGIDQLRLPDGDVFVRNLMHELGHCWSLREWSVRPSARAAWLAAMASDASAPSKFAAISFRNSGEPYEDAAESTALYFLVLGTPAFGSHRALMPRRFALLDAHFAE